MCKQLNETTLVVIQMIALYTHTDYITGNIAHAQ